MKEPRYLKCLQKSTKAPSGIVARLVSGESSYIFSLCFCVIVDIVFFFGWFVLVWVSGWSSSSTVSSAGDGSWGVACCREGGSGFGLLKKLAFGTYITSVLAAVSPLPRCISSPNLSKVFFISDNPLIISFLVLNMKAPSST